MREYNIVALEAQTPQGDGLYAISMSHEDEGKYDGGLRCGLENLLKAIAFREGYAVTTIEMAPLPSD